MATCEFENCSSVALLDDPDNYCFWHSLDPETIKKRLAGSSKRGKAGRKVLDPEHIAGLDLDELADLNRLLACLVGAVVTGRISMAAAKSAGYLVRCISQVHETSLLSARIAALQEQVAKIEMGT